MKARFTFMAVLLAALAAGAHAGQSCEQKPLTPQALQRGLDLAQRTHIALEDAHQRDGTQVVVLARAGQDLTAHGLRYSHLGWAYRLPDGTWRVLHKLNDCGTAKSAIFDEGLTNFFSDDPVKLEGGLWRLKPEVQAKLKKILLGRKAEDFHQPAYSMVAYPFSEKYQNSNGWVLEVLAFSLAPEYEADNRKTAQAWLEKEGYQPSTLELGTMTGLGARISKANIAFDDHPEELRWNGKIQTVTVKSVIDWLEKEQACVDPECKTASVTLESPMR